MLPSAGGTVYPAMSEYLRRITTICSAFLLLGMFAGLGKAQQSNDILPVDQVRAGMQGYACTVFSGDQVEKFDLEVLGVMPNFLGPKQSIILVELKGPKVEHTGVVAGMSGSPVYIEGKLAGALSLKLGIFTKEAIAGVTPIEDVLRSPVQSSAPQTVAQEFQLPKETAAQNTLPSGSTLEPIETPLVFSGFQPATLQQFAGQLQSYGLVATPGGSSPDQKDDAHAHLAPGDMAGMVLVRGDMSVNSACTVTAVRDDRVFLCGHPFLNLGDIQMPMARSEVVTTLSSSLASTKIVNVGGSIGTITSDHLTAVTGKLGAPPQMIPVDLTFVTGKNEKKLHFEMVNHPKLTPLLVAMTTFSGVTQNSLYGEGRTLHLTGEIQLKGHVPVKLENTFAPTDSLLPDGLPVALSVQSVFGRLFTNNFEIPDVEHVSLRVETLPGRNSYTIESAWLETGEASPGEDLKVRVLVQPYRGAPQVEETTVHVPDQIARGSTLRVLVSDAEWMNRASRGFNFGGIPGSASGPAGLDQLIALINRERHNDRLYVGIFMPAPMMVWDDKELPNVPLSAISVIDGRPAPGSVQVLRESLANESSVELGGPVSGLISLNLQIR
ncbi:MAG TPA: SpoIVB peptidase S55 domain-containing protein [Candidatus Sulfotelmatobacter sp.]|nr:SpoIVB peptidase S55 domain-containing protein [Candidatus Sulfotelmatobacter sp.]